MTTRDKRQWIIYKYKNKYNVMLVKDTCKNNKNCIFKKRSDNQI